MRIPIFVDESHVGFIREEAVLCRYLRAPNVKAQRNGRGDVIRADVSPMQGSVDEGHGIGPNSVLPTYEEDLGTGRPLTVLKRVNRFGEFARWNDADGFDPGRFNPDHIPAALRRR